MTGWKCSLPVLAALSLRPTLGTAAEVHDCAALGRSVRPEPSWYLAECLGGVRPVSPAAQPGRVPGDPTFIKNLAGAAPIGQSLLTAPVGKLDYTVVGAQPAPLTAVDFDNPAEVLWAINDTTRAIGTLDQATAAFTAVSNLTGVTAGWSITGLKFDPTSANVYLSATNELTSELYTVDLNTGAATLVGPITGFLVIIDIAIDNSGTIFGHDIRGDQIVRIDRTNGAPTVVGPTGQDTSFAQGMDFDPSTNTLYAFMYLGGGVNNLSTINTSTGAATVLVNGVVSGQNKAAIKVAVANLVRGDFDYDGKTDILWRHDVSGENVVWYMNGLVMTGGTFTTPSSLTDTRWKMVGTHDFDGDVKTDILWRHDTAGENVVWFMNGTVLNSGTFLTPAALDDTSWKMAGTGDFNGDGKPDIAWHHQGSGENVIWYMNGTTLVSGTFTSPPSFPDLNWVLVGVADFSVPADGKPDFVWRNQNTGENLMWFMNGTVKTGEAAPPALSDTRWKIVATGEFNFDGRNDFVWRHETSGENVMWFMNGATLLGGTFTTPAAFTDVRWKMVGPR